VTSRGLRERRREIGIRIALGATAADIRALVLRHAAVVVAVGVPAGVSGALLLGRWLGALAFEISPSDPRILVSAALAIRS
jgi:ABC-type antimicrobial peptide transport system permease subunit